MLSSGGYTSLFPYSNWAQYPDLSGWKSAQRCAESRRGSLKFRYPVANGMVIDWEDMVSFPAGAQHFA